MSVLKIFFFLEKYASPEYIKQKVTEYLSSNILISSTISTPGAVGDWINSTWWTPRAISYSDQCNTTDVKQAVICTIHYCKSESSQ